MDIFDEIEYNETHLPMFEKVVDMFESRPAFQRILRLGILVNINHDGGFHGSQMPGAVYHRPLHYYEGARGRHQIPHQPAVKAEAKDSEKRARLLQETKASKQKAEKKRLKKLRQKEKKRSEKAKNQDRVKKEEENNTAQKSKVEESQRVNGESSSGVGEQTSSSSSSSSSSEDESSEEEGVATDDSEELDLTSTFVSKAALIARRKMEPTTKPEKEKKKLPVKEPKIVRDEANEELEKKDSATSIDSTFEDNVKISTELAGFGNKFASAGDFNTAVKYFTDAIKYNPTEFKLFGNRSFCFEKMHQYAKALTDAELSLSMAPGWVKGFYRKGRALAGLERYEDAAQAFREVLKLDGSYAEAAQELLRVQTTQLMEYGFTREHSANAIIVHGTVPKALEALLQLKQKPGAVQNGASPLAQGVNVSRVSPVLSARAAVTPPPPPQSQEKPKTIPKTTNNQPPEELFPLWVGNLCRTVTEDALFDLFERVGVVHSVKIIRNKHAHQYCAFVNYTCPRVCREAITHFNGDELHGNKIVVKYPDRNPPGMGISRSARRAFDWHEEGQDPGEGGCDPTGPRLPYRYNNARTAEKKTDRNINSPSQ